MVGVDVHTLHHWERDGYDSTAQRGLALATALGTPVDTINFGRYLRGLVLPGFEFILAAWGRDDLGWKARIAEWRGEGEIAPPFAARANAGWLEAGQNSTLTLDRVERGIRAALDPLDPW